MTPKLREKENEPEYLVGSKPVVLGFAMYSFRAFPGPARAG